MAQDHTQRPCQPIVNDLPIARRNSAVRFLEKRRQRLASRHHGALQSGSEILEHRSASSSEFATANNGEHHGRQDQCGSSASHPEKERVKETNNREGRASGISREVLEQHFGKKREDVAKILRVSVSTFKRACREHGIPRWPYRRSNSVCRHPDQLEGQTMQFTTHPNPNPLVFPYPQTASIYMPSENEDGRNLLASRAESVLKGHVYESSNLVLRACSDATTPSQGASRVLQKIPTTTHMIPGTGCFFETVQLKCQLKQSTSHPNPNALVDLQTTMSSEYCEKFLGLVAESSLEGHVFYETLKVTYRGKTIKFELPLMSGMSELKKEVEERLKLELRSFHVEYKDEEDWIFLGRDEDFRDYLRRSSNQVIKLKIVDSDANTTNVSESCGSLERKRR